MRRIVTVACVTATLFGSLGASGPAQAIVRGANGRILYTRAIWRSSFTWQLQAADSDGSNAVTLATFPRDAFGDEMFANWSPDGSTVALNIFNAVWIVNADGSGLHELISCASAGVDCRAEGGFGEASFTPDGMHLVVGHCCTDGDGLYMLNTDGSQLKTIRTDRSGGSGFGNPQVSPDGRLIAFSSCPDKAPGCFIGTMTIMGGNVHKLTDPTKTSWDFPNWSPDSKRIVISDVSGTSGNVAIVNSDGTHFRRLTSNPDGVYSAWACFSPDGSKLLYSHRPSTSGWDLYTMNPDGTGGTKVASTADYEFWPQWGTLARN